MNRYRCKATIPGVGEVSRDAECKTAVIARWYFEHALRQRGIAFENLRVRKLRKPR